MPDGDTDFSTGASLEIQVSQRSLRDARDEIENRIGDMEVGVTAELSGADGGGGPAEDYLAGLLEVTTNIHSEVRDLPDEIGPSDDDDGRGTAAAQLELMRRTLQEQKRSADLDAETGEHLEDLTDSAATIEEHITGGMTQRQRMQQLTEQQTEFLEMMSGDLGSIQDDIDDMDGGGGGLGTAGSFLAGRGTASLGAAGVSGLGLGALGGTTGLATGGILAGGTLAGLEGRDFLQEQLGEGAFQNREDMIAGTSFGMGDQEAILSGVDVSERIGIDAAASELENLSVPGFDTDVSEELGIDAAADALGDFSISESIFPEPPGWWDRVFGGGDTETGAPSGTQTVRERSPTQPGFGDQPSPSQLPSNQVAFGDQPSPEQLPSNMEVDTSGQIDVDVSGELDITEQILDEVEDLINEQEQDIINDIERKFSQYL